MLLHLREFLPGGHFCASFYVRCGDRFELAEADGAHATTPIDHL